MATGVSVEARGLWALDAGWRRVSTVNRAVDYSTALFSFAYIILFS